MTPLYQDPGFTFRFEDDRIISRFHLEGVQAGRRVQVFMFDPGTGAKLGLLTRATAGEGGWVDLVDPIIVETGEAFVAILEPATTNDSLCESCQHMREVITPKTSRFLLCQRSSTDARYAKYPPQPILQCDGHKPSE